MSARTGKIQGTRTIAFVLVGTVLASSTLALAQRSISSQQGRSSAPLATQVHKEGFSIGPVPGLTTRWHPAPAESWIPVGTSPKFYCPAGIGTNVVWSGAVETSRNRFGSFAQAILNELGPHTVGVTVLGGGSTLGQNVCNLTIVDHPVDSIVLSSMAVRVDPVVIDEQASPEEINEQTLAYYHGRSIASLQDFGGGAYLTSINREVLFSLDVSPAEFAPLVEWRFAGETTYAGMGADVRHVFSQVGNHELSAGPSPVALGGLLVETYAATITSHTPGDIIPTGVPIVFTAITDPPGYESSITWMSSTLYGTASPVLGQGPTFTAIFEDTFGPHQDGGVWEWLGVKADNVTFGQDQKTIPCCIPDLAECLELSEDECMSVGGEPAGNPTCSDLAGFCCEPASGAIDDVSPPGGGEGIVGWVATATGSCPTLLGVDSLVFTWCWKNAAGPVAVVVDRVFVAGCPAAATLTSRQAPPPGATCVQVKAEVNCCFCFVDWDMGVTGLIPVVVGGCVGVAAGCP